MESLAGTPPLTPQLSGLSRRFSAAPVIVESYDEYPGMHGDALAPPAAPEEETFGGCVPFAQNRARFLASARGWGQRNFEELVTRFSRAGGRIAFSPTEEEVKELHNFHVHVRPEDFVIPICHEGMNRSQVMYLVLQTLKRSLSSAVASAAAAAAAASGAGTEEAVPEGATPPARVCVPHGAETGFDPHQAYADLTEDSMYGFINGVMRPRQSEGEWLHENFFATFGVDKSRRIGQLSCQQLGYELNPLQGVVNAAALQKLSGHRSAQREVMNQLVYNVEALRRECGEGGRVIVFAFMRAPAIFLSRLLEVNEGNSLEGVCIIALPYGDNIGRAGGSDEIAAYTAANGVTKTRDELSCMRHEEVFAFYTSLLQPVARVAARAPTLCTRCGSACDVPAEVLAALHTSISKCSAAACIACWAVLMAPHSPFVASVGLNYCPCGSRGQCMVNAAVYQTSILPRIKAI